MAPKKGSSDDIGWQYGTMLDSRHNFKCNYCNFMGQGGGVSRDCKKEENKEMQERIISGWERDEDVEDEVERMQNMCLILMCKKDGPEHRAGLRHGKLTKGQPTESVFRELSMRLAVAVAQGEHGKQTRIEDAYNQQGLKYKVARATTERGEYELDVEVDDHEDPPRPNTFLARVVAEATTEEEGARMAESGRLGESDPADPDPGRVGSVDPANSNGVWPTLDRDIELERVERLIGGGHGHDDDDFERWMEGILRIRSLREAPSQSRRRGSSTQIVEVAVVVTHLREVEVVTVVREEEMETNENLEDASNELILSDEDVLRFQIGEVFAHMPREDVEDRLEKMKEEASKELEKLEEEKESILAQMAELKKILYGKFKDSINLEED
ncbi:hypothetical protein Taro_019457 [Colocasia esculenta]|uniref:Prefoldin subunit 4 n=1 Tax=Colocasia esculenta TaxID=4460 RepID=A0A843UWU1_COLES|nr:hypothetical protein [Colocasia esculenta]